MEAQRSIDVYYPAAGPLARSNYPKHMEFYAAGRVHQERAFVAGNRVGKTHCVCYESTLHMLGRYPSWWEGRRFDDPVTVWASGEDAKSVRDSLQEKFIGKPEAKGTGLVPAKDLVEWRPRQGIPDAVDFFTVKHVSGGRSRCFFKSYDQGREAFQAAQVDIMVFDEEPPMDIYTEGLTRTMSTTPGLPNGMVLCSFTPLKGISDVVLMFLPGGTLPRTEALRKETWGW